MRIIYGTYKNKLRQNIETGPNNSSINTSFSLKERQIIKYISKNTKRMKPTLNKNPSRNPFPHIVAAILSTSRIKPNFPMPPKRPSVGTSLQGPRSRNPAMHLEAENTELANVAKKKAPHDQKTNMICT